MLAEAAITSRNRCSASGEPTAAIFPMSQKESPTTLRLVEIYQNEEAYQAHLQTPHFQHYKTSTLHMVKSLKLVEMDAIDPESMSKIFKKISQE